MEYELVYDFAREGFRDLVVLLIPIGILAITILTASFRERINRYLQTNISKGFAISLIAFTSLIGGIQSFDFISDFIAFRNATLKGTYFEVEGSISEYNRGRPRTPNIGGLTESFVVNNTKFELRKTVGGYTRTQEEGSPLNLGDQVRIAYITTNNERVILRLEKAK